MRVLVTGGAGFIGSHLVRYLVDRGDDVIVLDDLRRGNKLDRESRAAARLLRGDVRSSEVVQEACVGCDVVYHLAAVLGVDAVADNPLETMEVEVLGMRNLVEACTYHGIRKIVYSSTSGVYGKKAMETAVTEVVIPSPSSSYSIAKRFNEIYLAAALQERGINSISARFFNVYGPRQDERMVLPRFVAQARAGEPITVYGSGKQTRDFTYVGDCVHALVQLGDRVEGCEIFNIARGEDIPIQEVAKIVKEFFESSSEIVNLTAPKTRYDFEVEKRFGNSDKLEKAIGYRPSTNFRDGFLRTYEAATSSVLVGRGA
jgi:nucleoside-diphosphate-sugar epimerase